MFRGRTVTGVSTFLEGFLFLKPELAIHTRFRNSGVGGTCGSEERVCECVTWPQRVDYHAEVSAPFRLIPRSLGGCLHWNGTRHMAVASGPCDLLALVRALIYCTRYGLLVHW